MSLENDFLVFAGASGANVLSQSAYAAASATATGYVSGTASSAAVNKTLRQTSIMSAMLAQFIVDKASAAVIDDGTISTIETNFEAAILAIADTVNIPISQVTGLSAALAGYLPLHATADTAAKLATARNIALTGVVTGAVNFDGSANVSMATTFQNLAASSLFGNPTGSSATPQAITLTNGLVFSSTTLGLGAITPSSVSTAGTVSLTNGTTSYVSLTNGGYLAKWAAGAYINSGPGGGSCQIGTTVSGGNPLSLVNSSGTSVWGCDSNGNAIQTGDILFQTETPQITYPGGGFIGSNGTTGAVIWIGTNATSGNILGLFSSTSANKWVCDVSGNVTQQGTQTATGYSVSSDERLKLIEGVVDPRPLHELPYLAFSYRASGQRSRGPTAQAVATIAPEYVHTYVCDDPDEGPCDRLSIERDAIALEISVYAARGLDQLRAELHARNVL